MTYEPSPTLFDTQGNLILRIEGQQIFDADGNLLALVENRIVRSPKGGLLGRVTPQGRYLAGAPTEVVVVVDELRDVMGKLVGRFENSTREQCGLLAVVYGQLVTNGNRNL
jgi:hypothetical protein